MIEIRKAQFPVDTEHVLLIFREYINSASVSLDFQDYKTEFSNLSSQYTPPEGSIFLAWSGAEVIGCAAFRKATPRVCEMKRVYVRPKARNLRLGKSLIVRVIEEAKAVGYEKISLDVLPEFVKATRLYEALGFQDSPPITYNPVPDTRFMSLNLKTENKPEPYNKKI